MTPENPPAFPRTGEGVGNPHYDVPGMDMRDWFAGQVAPSIVLSPAQGGHQLSFEETARVIALSSYLIADAMLTVRQEQGK